MALFKRRYLSLFCFHTFTNQSLKLRKTLNLVRPPWKSTTPPSKGAPPVLGNATLHRTLYVSTVHDARGNDYDDDNNTIHYLSILYASDVYPTYNLCSRRVKPVSIITLFYATRPPLYRNI